MSLKRVNDNPYSKQVYNNLKNAIINLEISPGEKIVEDKLADKMGTSRTPIRQAIAYLEVEGFIENNPYQNKRVSLLDFKVAREAYEVKVALEAQAIKIVSSKLDFDDYNYLEELLKKAEKSCHTRHQGGYKKWADLNDKFHQYFVDKTDNDMFIKINDNIHHHVQRARVKFALDFKKDIEKMNEYHNKILEMIKKKNTEKAIYYLEIHTKYFIDEIKQIIND